MLFKRLRIFVVVSSFMGLPANFLSVPNPTPRGRGYIVQIIS
jgi:hypothetical protein